MKIIHFSFAGGNKYSLNKIFNQTSCSFPIEINRNNSDLNTTIEEILNDLKKDNIKSEYIIYGHSMGALLAYLLCHKLQEENLPMPLKLIVSGKKAPAIPRENKIFHLPDEEFWNEIVALGGIPDEMLNYPELIDYYLPILRHDFKLVESYKYEKKPKLNISIDVFYGSEEATEEEMLGWKEETTENVTITKLEGNHFFIFNHIEYFQNYFNSLTQEKTNVENII
ncbi:thioesterase II family protein [Flavobacterium columnare]|uniref:thioesterase II family protein n=1 Tax=Flavobacterium columnare TaxID=996 RepID=UPI0040334D78